MKLKDDYDLIDRPGSLLEKAHWLVNKSADLPKPARGPLRSFICVLTSALSHFTLLKVFDLRRSFRNPVVNFLS